MAEGDTSNARSVWDQKQVDALFYSGYQQYSWYENEAKSAEKKLSIVTWLGIISGFTASALAAMPPALTRLLDCTAEGQATRWVIAVLTLLTTLFSSTLASRYRRLANTRERGRIATALCLNITRPVLMNQPMTPLERMRPIIRFEQELLAVDGTLGALDGQSPDGNASGAQPKA